jgi:transposase-like protein
MGSDDMPRKRFKAEEIISKLREAEFFLSQDKDVSEACRQIGVTDQTYYPWRKEYGGIRTDQAKRRRKGEYVRDTLGRDRVSECRACCVLGQSRSTQRRTLHIPDDEPRLVQ